jgi:hypothetical protein
MLDGYPEKGQCVLRQALKETGPLVVYAPPKVIGMFTDFYQRTPTNVGAAGPDRARGGLYLLLPPDYEGLVPGDYFAFKSPTYIEYRDHV